MTRQSLRNNDEVAHYWAGKTQESGYSGNIRFDGPYLFSYSTLIGMHVDGGVLLESRDYHGVTTSTHIGLAMGAVRGRRVVSLPPSMRLTRSTTAAEVMQAWLTIRDAKLAELATVTRKPSRRKLLRELMGAVDDAASAAELAGIDESGDESGGVSEELYAEHRGYEAELDAQRRARGAARWARQEQAMADSRRDLPTAIAEWRTTGKTLGYRLMVQCREQHGDLLRLEAGYVHTSQNLRVSASEVKSRGSLLLGLVRRAQRQGQARDITGVSLDGFSVNTARADGTLIVGCHEFRLAELERLARELEIEGDDDGRG